MVSSFMFCTSNNAISDSSSSEIILYSIFFLYSTSLFFASSSLLNYCAIFAAYSYLTFAISSWYLFSNVYITFS
jgi:hypothetical protein